jgi:hypothetical protein
MRSHREAISSSRVVRSLTPPGSAFIDWLRPSYACIHPSPLLVNASPMGECGGECARTLLSSCALPSPDSLPSMTKYASSSAVRFWNAGNSPLSRNWDSGVLESGLLLVDRCGLVAPKRPRYPMHWSRPSSGFMGKERVIGNWRPTGT